MIKTIICKMKRVFKLDKPYGGGNITLMLTIFIYECTSKSIIPYIDETLMKDGRNNYIKINIDTPDEELEVLKPNLFINQHTHQIYSHLMSSIITPTDSMQKLIDQHIDLIKDVKCALHIRRGACQKDSSNMGCHSGKPAYFATETALNRFKDIIKQTDGNVFIASDSRELKEQLRQEFGEKVKYLDTDISLSYTCLYHPVDTDEVARRNCYLEWFLLSMCPEVYVTAGNPDMTDFSTFGYSAAAYGKKPVMMVHN
jgi:hypothetical protein